MSRDIGIIIRRIKGKLKFMIQYSSELFDDTVAENFAEQLRHTLSLISSGAETVREAAELPERQRSVLEGYSVEAKADIPVTLLHKLFEQQVQRSIRIKPRLSQKDTNFTYKGA